MVKSKLTRASTLLMILAVIVAVVALVFFIVLMVIKERKNSESVLVSEFDAVSDLVAKDYYNNFIESGAPEGRDYYFGETIPSAYYLDKGYSLKVTGEETYEVCMQEVCRSYDVKTSRHKPIDEPSIFAENTVCGVYYTEINRGQNISYTSDSKTLELDMGRTFSVADAKVYDGGNNCTELGLSVLDVKPLPHAAVYFDTSSGVAKLVAIKLLR